MVTLSKELMMDMVKKAREEIIKQKLKKQGISEHDFYAEYQKVKETLEATRERAHELLMLSREQKEELTKAAKRIEELEKEIKYLTGKVEIKENAKREALENVRELEQENEYLRKENRRVLYNLYSVGV